MPLNNKDCVYPIILHKELNTYDISETYKQASRGLFTRGHMQAYTTIVSKTYIKLEPTADSTCQETRLYRKFKLIKITNFHKLGLEVRS